MTQFRAGQRLTADVLNLLVSQVFKSDQVADPPFNATGSFVDFLPESFPAVNIDVPAGARLRITASARCTNTASAGSTCYLSWRASGANTIADQFNTGVGGGGTATIVRAANTHLTNPLAAGLTTITPQWQISSGTSSTAGLGNGHLIIEVVA